MKSFSLQLSAENSKQLPRVKHSVNCLLIVQKLYFTALEHAAPTGSNAIKSKGKE